MMPNHFKDNAAPYIVALLISGVGWLISQAYDDLKSSYVVEYDLEYSLSQQEFPVAIVTFKNLSHRSEMLHLEIRFKCGSNKSGNSTPTKCYEIGERLPVGQNSSLVQATLGKFDIKLPGQVIITLLELPSGTEVKYFLPLASKNAKIRFEFVVEGKAKSKRTILAEHGDIRVLVLKYFLNVAVWAFVALVMILGIFALVSLGMLWLSRSHVPNERGVNSGRKVYKVTVTDDGN